MKRSKVIYIFLGLLLYLFSISDLSYGHDNEEVHPWIVQSAYDLLPNSPLKSELSNFVNFERSKGAFGCDLAKDESSSNANELTLGANLEDVWFYDFRSGRDKCLNWTIFDILTPSELTDAYSHHFNDPSINSDWNGLPFVYEDPYIDTDPFNIIPAKAGLGTLYYIKNFYLDRAKDLYYMTYNQGNYSLEKRRAYWYLGRIAHLLADMSVPYHVRGIWHPIIKPYETYVKGAGGDKKNTWKNLVSSMPSLSHINNIPSLFEELAKTTFRYPIRYCKYYNCSGTALMLDCEVCKSYEGDPNLPSDIDSIADRLMPLSIKYTQRLFELFYQEVNDISKRPVNVTKRLSIGATSVPAQIMVTFENPKKNIQKQSFYLYADRDYDSRMEINIFTPNSPITSANFERSIRIEFENYVTSTKTIFYYPFRDVSPTAWYDEFVVTLWAKDVINDVGYFRPADGTTRAEFIKMAVLAAKKECSKNITCNYTPSYTDISATHWAYPYVKAAFNLGWITDGATFRPDEFINRAEASKIISIAKGYNEVLGIDPDSSSFLNKITDVNTQEWYANYVFRVYKYDVAKGYVDNTFKPANIINRAESAKFIYKAFLEVQ